MPTLEALQSDTASGKSRELLDRVQAKLGMTLNIRVNAVAPGVIRTPIYGDSDVDAFSSVALLNRVGEVSETTDAVLYLATANFTNGQILRVDGGYVTGRR